MPPVPRGSVWQQTLEGRGDYPDDGDPDCSVSFEYAVAHAAPRLELRLDRIKAWGVPASHDAEEPPRVTGG